MTIFVKSLYYEGYPLPDTLYSKKVKEELAYSVESVCDTHGKNYTSPLSKTTTNCQLNYINGLVNLDLVKKDRDGRVVHENLVIDVLMINFFFKTLPFELGNSTKDSKIIKNFINRLESIPCSEEIKKISDIYFSILNKYIDMYDQNWEGLRDNPINNFSNYLICSNGVKSFFQLQSPILFTTPAIGDLSLLPKRSRFYKLMTKFPPLLSKSESKIFKIFLERSLSQKKNFQEKIFFFKQILFLCLFKNALYSILQSLENQFERAPCSEQNRSNRDLLEYIRNSLTKFCSSELLLTIPLACRSSPIDKGFFPLFVSKSFEEEQIDTAKNAYQMFIELFVENFWFSHENLGDKISSNISSLQQEEASKINRFIKTFSSLAISGGPFARSAFYTYCIEGEEEICENLPLELILTAAQHYSLEDTWLEEVYLGYICKIFGKISLLGISLIREKIQKISTFIETVPMENLLKKNKQNEIILSENPLDRFKCYYIQGCRSLNLPF